MTLTSHEDTEKKRTLKQNACLHSYFQQLADEMNAAGYTADAVIKVPISFTAENVKEYMCKPVMRVLYPEIESTTELDTQQLQFLYENMNNLTGQKFGVSLDWPTRWNGGVGK